MFAVRLSGALTSSPSATSCDDVPAVMNMTFGLSAANKSLACESHALLNFNSTSAFADTRAVGSAVTKATLIILKAKSPILLRLTTDDGVGGDVVATIPVSGLYLLETDASKPVKLLEAKGAGVLEYFAAGPQ